MHLVLLSIERGGLERAEVETVKWGKISGENEIGGTWVAAFIMLIMLLTK